MNQSSNENSGGVGAAKTSMASKIGYIGTGVLIGLIIYPFVRKALAKVQPKVDAIFDDLTGKAEDFVEKASDLMARARTTVSKEELAKNNGQHHS